MHVLNAGVDTLVVGYGMAGPMPDLLRHRLDHQKTLAQQTKFGQSTATVHIGGATFNIKPYGSAGYDWLLNNDDITMRIAGKWQAGRLFPEIMVEYRSKFLWQHGHHAAMAQVRRLIRLIAGIPTQQSQAGEPTTETISRIDASVDCTGVLPNIDLQSTGIRGYARRRAEFTANRYTQTRFTTGYVFGSGAPLMFRLYNKSDEIARTRKTWFQAIWKKAGWDGVTPITRAEFQIRREAIHQWEKQGITDIDQMLSNAWWYLTNRWLTLRTPQENDTNTRRWPVIAWWAVLQQAWTTFGQVHGVLRCQTTKPRIEHLLKMIGGCTTTIIAIVAGHRNYIDEAHANVAQMVLETITASHVVADVTRRIGVVASL